LRLALLKHRDINTYVVLELKPDTTLTLYLDGGELRASRSDCFNLDEISPVPIAQEDRTLKMCPSEMRLSLPSIELQ